MAKAFFQGLISFKVVEILEEIISTVFNHKLYNDIEKSGAPYYLLPNKRVYCETEFGCSFYITFLDHFA